MTPIVKNVKEYTKQYKRTNKKGQKVTRTSTQQLINLTQKDNFAADQEVYILTKSEYDKLQLRSNPEHESKIIKDFQDKEIDFYNKLQDKENIINDLNNEISQLQDKQQSINKKHQEELNFYNNQKIEIAELKAKAENIDNIKEGYKDLVNMLLKTSNIILGTAIKNAVSTTFKTDNKQVKGLGLIQRLKGVSLKEPDINTDKIQEDSYKELKSMINNSKLLE